MSLFISKSFAQTAIETIKVAVHSEPPFSSKVDGKFVGQHIDIIELLAKKLNKKIQYIQCPAARCFTLMRNGSADIMLGVRKLKQREKFLHFLDSPIRTQTQPLKFYTHSCANISIDEYNDLKPLLVGVLRGASYFAPFDDDTNIKKVPVTSHRQLVDMLLNNRIDTFLEREESIIPLVNQQVYQEHIQIADYSHDMSVGSYIAISKNSPLVLEADKISAVFETLLSSGDIEIIKQRYLN